MEIGLQLPPGRLLHYVRGLLSGLGGVYGTASAFLGRSGISGSDFSLSGKAFVLGKGLFPHVGQGTVGGTRTLLGFLPSLPGVIDREAKTSEAQQAQSELEERHVKCRIRRLRFAILDVEGPFIAVAGFSALATG